MARRKRIAVQEEDEKVKIAAGGGNVPQFQQPVNENDDKEKDDEDEHKLIPFPGTQIKKQYEMRKSYNTMDDFQRIAFASRALTKEKNSSRLYSTVLKIEYEYEKKDPKLIRCVRIIGSDGRRLHVAEISTILPEGFYNVQVRTNVITLQEYGDDIHFPNWRGVLTSLNKLEEIGECDLNNTSLTKNLTKTGEISKQFAKLIKASNKVLNIRYLDDLEKIVWTAYKETRANGAFVFKLENNKELIAVIMPLEYD
jgi:hypothetical protein